ncbi:unnamed protein product [Mesocestoides corti]|uniref:UBA domain-containing protein n=1 Tax=Mesocestoides corti TaxID=53468 RepID=A0A0R3U1B3_MESCO|nr:unnamed protein product [Mesocestoides corti]
MPKNNDLLKGNKSKKGQAAGSGSSTSKMPKATVEQLNLALLLDKKIDVDAYEFKLQQIQECTACTKDEAIAAMHDADNNVHLAIENLLDQKSENDDWKDTVTKRSRSRKQAEVKPNVPLSAPNNTESISQNDESRSLSDLRSQKTLNSVSTKKSSAKPQAVPNLANGLSSDSLLPDSASTQPDAERDENWDLDCGEWRGEAIEVVNSASSLKVNIHEDSELLRLVTCDSPEPQQTPSDIEEIKVEDEPEKASGGALAEDRGADVSQQSKPVKASGESVESIKAWLFSTYARSAPPPSSHIPKVPVFFAPGSRNSVVSPSAQALERGTTQTQNTSPLRQLEFPCTNPPQNLEPLKSDHHPERKPRTKNQLTDASNRLKAQNQCGFSPVMTTLLHPIPKLQQDLQTDHAYSAAIQNTSALKEAYAKLQDHESPPSCPPNQPVNNFENPSPYEYNLLGELSQNIKQVGLEPQSGKSDAFTQSLSSNQPEVIMPPSYHSMQPAKPVVSQPPQINKPVSTMPPSANQQPLSTTQPQLHPAMHPGLPQLLSQFQTTFPMYNLPSGSGTAAPHLFDLDQLQALQQQQRMLFELQQSQQQQQSQSVATEPNLPNTCADVLPSSKSSVPMHHVTTPNVGHGFTFLPYHGMVLMVRFVFQLISFPRTGILTLS